MKDDNLTKIRNKLILIAETRRISNININEFKNILWSFKIPKCEWYKFMRQLEEVGVLNYHRNHYLEVKMYNSPKLDLTKPLPDKPHKRRQSKRLL